MNYEIHTDSYFNLVFKGHLYHLSVWQVVFAYFEIRTVSVKYAVAVTKNCHLASASSSPQMIMVKEDRDA